MPTCVVCNGTEFLCDSGFYFCAECQTQSQEVRVVVDEGDAVDDNEDFTGARDTLPGKSNAPGSKAEDNEETLTIWEGFNFALIGLVNQLIQLGATPKVKLTVLQLWSKYLQRLEIAFYSSEMTFPKLGPNFRQIDAKLIYGYSGLSKSEKNMDTDDPDSGNVGDIDLQAVETDTLADSATKKKILKRAKKAVIKQNYEKAITEMTLASQTLASVTLDMLSTDTPGEERTSESVQFGSGTKMNLPKALDPGILLRSRLIAFLYLGILTCEENICLSDLLRWIEENYLCYNSLWKYFPDTGVIGHYNHTLFVKQQSIPSHIQILKISFYLAKYLQLDAVKAPSLHSRIQHYVKELNLPAQVGLISKRLLDLQPPLPDRFDFLSNVESLPNWEGIAMAHILVALKLTFGLDDSTEYQNSRIARKLNEYLNSQGNSVQLFVWEEWERFCVFRRTALSLFHYPTYLKSRLEMQTSTIQNADPIIRMWDQSYSPDIARHTAHRSEVMKQTMLSCLDKLEAREWALAGSEVYNTLRHIVLAPSTAPLSSSVQLIVDCFKNGHVQADDSEMGELIQGLPHDYLASNFRDKSIEYLIHPATFIEWAQGCGLCVGLHSGSRASFIAPKHKVPKIDHMKTKTKKNYWVKVVCDVLEKTVRTDMPVPLNSVRPYKFRKPLILPKSTENSEGRKFPFPVIGGMRSEKTVTNKTLGKSKLRSRREAGNRKKMYFDAISEEDEEKMLYVPHTEYWRSECCTSYEDATNELPLSFQRSLEECASLIEMKPFDLYKEVIHVEALQESLFPSESELFPNCETHSTRIQNLKDWWINKV